MYVDLGYFDMLRHWPALLIVLYSTLSSSWMNVENTTGSRIQGFGFGTNRTSLPIEWCYTIQRSGQYVFKHENHQQHQGGALSPQPQCRHLIFVLTSVFPARELSMPNN